MRKNILFVFSVVALGITGRGQVVGGITATPLAAHLYNSSGSAGYLTFGFTSVTGAGTGTPDPLTIRNTPAGPRSITEA